MDIITITDDAKKAIVGLCNKSILVAFPEIVLWLPGLMGF